MSIEKLNPRIRGEAIPYTQVDSRVVQKIRNLEAGFIWVYLLTLPPDWNVVKKVIKERFGFGNDKLKQIFSYLAKHRLIEYVRSHDERGVFVGIDINVLNGSQFIETVDEKDSEATGGQNTPAVLSTGGKKPPMVKSQVESGFAELSTDLSSTGGIIHPVDYPPAGFQATTDKTLLTEKREKKERPSLSTFQPPQAALEAAAAKNVEISALLEKFRLHYGNENEFARNWPELFHKWVLSEKISKDKPCEGKMFADVTKQSTSFGHEIESAEESQRKWEERMKEYGRPMFGT